jgi:hypothetical protein
MGRALFVARKNLSRWYLPATALRNPSSATSAAGRLRSHVRIQTGDGFAASGAIRREEISLEFETLEQALDWAGTSRISGAGVIVGRPRRARRAERDMPAKRRARFFRH